MITFNIHIYNYILLLLLLKIIQSVSNIKSKPITRKTIKKAKYGLHVVSDILLNRPTFLSASSPSMSSSSCCEFEEPEKVGPCE